ncbi:MAG: iron ABC transporter permease [Alphaproteobacteria bacterium]|nr:iron ABC transporter permease [Brevundimonas sp.]MBU3972306.1 iron ABC transporter permease [Alphaproteobacteria bacterium]MBU4038955.1 iron ABC transporter permease [Alphaproteobacteria bacterium]MBU4135962.1 iron ABC transporter permease [Alphaproteobacteria bacterium]
MDPVKLRGGALLPLALVLLALAGVLAVMATGPLGVSPGDLLAAAVGRGTPEAELALALRGPRLLAAVTCGAALAGAGAGFQILFRNPLAAPDLLGVSSGAGLGAALALLFGAGAALVQGAAFAGGLAAGGLALACAALTRSGDGRLALILCGVVAGALASAGLGLVVVVAEPYAQLPSITYWLLGSFTRATLGEAVGGLIPVALGAGVLIWLGYRLDILSLGDEQARSLGLKARRVRLLALGAAALMTSSAVAVAGVVGWIGLLAPHAARLVVGERAGQLIPASMALGALFALVIDRLATAFGPAEIPVGLLSAAIGAPAFLILFVATSRRS